MTFRIAITTRAVRAGAITVSAAVVAVGLAAGSASASNDGYFIPGSDLPSGSAYTPWTAASPKHGLPAPMYTCIKGVLPKSTSGYRLYGSDGSAEVREIITRTSSKAKAKTLVRSLRKGVTNCADSLEDVTDVTRYGRYSTEEGLTIDGVFSAPPNSEYSFQLFGIGRDGKNVVVTSFSDMGRQGDAPVSKFTTSAKRALKKAF